MFIYNLARLLNSLIGVYIWVVILRALLSWFNADPFGRFMRLVEGLTEPVLRPIRRVIPYIAGIDFSPVVAVLLLYLFRSLIFRVLLNIALRRQ